MQSNFHTNNFLENLSSGLAGSAKAAETQECFDNQAIADFWKSISNSQREEILIIKDLGIIEKFAQAVNGSSLAASISKEGTQQRAEKRTFAYNKQDRPGMILSIIEFNNIALEGDNFQETIYYMSTVVLILEDAKVTNESNSAYQEIEEKSLQEFIFNIELLEKHRALLKIKYSKLENILTTFTRMSHTFCHGNKKIIPESEYENQFNLSSQEAFQSQQNKKFSTNNFLTIRRKTKIYLKSVFNIFENNILQAYCQHTRPTGSLKIQELNIHNQFVPFANQNGFYPQQQYQYHQNQQLMGPYPLNGNLNTINNYRSYYTNANSFIPHANGIYGEFSVNLLGQPTSKWIPVAQGIYFGSLTFEIKDHEAEELEFSENDQHHSRNAKAQTGHFKQNGNFFDGRNKTKRNHTYTHGANHVDNGAIPNGNPVALGYTQSLQNVDPLQFLLGKTSPYVMMNQHQQPQPQQKPFASVNIPQTGQPMKLFNSPIDILFQNPQQQHQLLQNVTPQASIQKTKANNPPPVIPLLETIIRIPTSTNANNSSKNANQGQESQQYYPKTPQKMTIFSHELSKLPQEFSNDKNTPTKNQDNDIISHLQGQINNFKQDDTEETSTTISVESGGKTSDKDSIGDTTFNPPNYSYSNSKKKSKGQNAGKVKNNGKYTKEWDHTSTSGTQSRRLSDISQNFDYTIDFPALLPINNRSQASSKDRI